jgi:cardiolipin synthase (CMP-forming)
LRTSRRLRLSLAAWSILGLLATTGFAVALAEMQHTVGVWVIAALAVAWWALVWAVVLGGAALLVTPAGEPVDLYGIPNGMTALRAWLCMPLLLCAVLSLPGRTGLVLWGAVGGPVGLLDAADGFIARRFGRITVLGKALDPFMDSLFFVAASAGSLLLGILPLWLAVLIAFRYGAPLLGTPIVLLARRRPELVHTVWGRRNTLLTGAVLFVLLLVRVVDGPVQTVALAIALPTLVPTMLLHFAALERRTLSAPIAR